MKSYQQAGRSSAAAMSITNGVEAGGWPWFERQDTSFDAMMTSFEGRSGVELSDGARFVRVARLPFALSEACNVAVPPSVPLALFRLNRTGRFIVADGTEAEVVLVDSQRLRQTAGAGVWVVAIVKGLTGAGLGAPITSFQYT